MGAAMQSLIQPILTVYQGYAFRSRLEARWAVFFDCLELEWVYEHEGYNLGALGYYLPDFRVTTRTHCNSDGTATRGRRIWVEIKADAPSDEECAKLALLCAGTGLDGHIISGDPLRASIDTAQDGPDDRKHSVGLESLANIFECNFTRTISAANAARQARFEHGESGAPTGTWK
jgi:hypothetical protein